LSQIVNSAGDTVKCSPFKNEIREPSSPGKQYPPLNICHRKLYISPRS